MLSDMPTGVSWVDYWGDRGGVPTGGRATCVWCGLELEEVQDSISFTLDYGIDGDFGCGLDPWSDDYGTGSHVPYVEAGRLYVLEGDRLGRVRFRARRLEQRDETRRAL
jgi:hypothetical protein